MLCPCQDPPLISCPCCRGRGEIKAVIVDPLCEIVETVDYPTLAPEFIIPMECPRCFGHRYVEKPDLSWDDFLSRLFSKGNT